MKQVSPGLNYCNEHVYFLEKKRTDGRLPLSFVGKKKKKEKSWERCGGGGEVWQLRCVVLK